jgi:hypothetical protein
MTTIAMSLVNAARWASLAQRHQRCRSGRRRCATNGIVASGLMLNSLHPDVALHPVRSFSMALREGPLAWGSNSHVYA